MNRTGCRDASLATEALIENSGNLNQAVDYLLSVALFVAPGDDGNLSRAINGRDMEMMGKLHYFLCSVLTVKLNYNQAEVTDEVKVRLTRCFDLQDMRTELFLFKIYQISLRNIPERSFNGNTLNCMNFFSI